MARLVLVVALGGCSLYFGPSHDPPTSASSTVTFDAAPASIDADICPATGTHAEITYPADGATNVPTPVPISMSVYIPNTLDGKGIYLSDANGQQVDLSHWDASCSVPPPAIETGPVQNVSWVECYDLPPDSQFTWHIWITCYDASGPHEIATSTCLTAP